ncbi:MAG: type II toxin-antitoxin system RelE/ParE family toxin [Verrucomicrobia bacterium]|nr:type II toxin-antitoxin system RelE/ParE family toxin [Verrucomicrobiota bacterium]
MAFQVILSPTAENDLEGIVAYIAVENPAAAERFGLESFDAALTLAELPRRGRPFRRDGRIRRIVHGNYLIIYRLNEVEKTVEVLRFWHAARGEPRL